MTWLYILFAAIVEIFWVLGLGYSDNIWQWTGTVAMIVLSIFFVIKACEKIPSGTVYAIFTGLGATALIFIDLFVIGLTFSTAEILFISLIIIGVIGLKLTSNEEKIRIKKQH
jgi:paired small multidrug resistance pump